MQLNHLDCFSGIGGFTLAAESEGFHTVAFVECEETKRLVLRHWWPDITILPDIRDTAAIARFRQPLQPLALLTGGVPCQPASLLGQRRGTADERWLWPDTIKLVRAVRPWFGLFENPPAILTLESGRAWNGIVSALVALGYDLWWDVFPAAAFGAGHLRERVILTIADSERIAANQTHPVAAERRTRPEPSGSGNCASTDSHDPRLQGHPWHDTGDRGRPHPGRPASPPDLSGTAPDPAGEQARSAGLPRRHGDVEARLPDLRGRVSTSDWWLETHTGIPVLASGLPNKLVEAATRCIGDSVVPQVLIQLLRAIRQQIILDTQHREQHNQR